MKSERSFACGQRVRTNCYMAIVQGYGCMYVYKNVHALIQGNLHMYAYTSMYYAIGDRTYVHIRYTYMCKYVCVRMDIIYCTNMRTYVCVCVTIQVYAMQYACVRTYILTMYVHV